MFTSRFTLYPFSLLILLNKLQKRREHGEEKSPEIKAIAEL
jgi:hypothetical protein